MKNKHMVEVKSFMFVTFAMFSGPVRRLRLANKAGQPRSDWGAIPLWRPKTTSHCRGTLHRNQTQLFTWQESSTQHLIWHVYRISPAIFGTNTSQIEISEAELWAKWHLWDHCCHEKLANVSLTLFPSTVTVQRGRVTVVLSTFCGRASMHVHSAPKTTTERSSALVSREYR